MNLRKLPPSMLLTLGLACGDGKSSDETTVNACLSPMPSTETDDTMGPCLDIGPCLSETAFPTTGESSSGTSGTGSSGADSTFGPCLSPEPPGTSTDTGTGTDTDGTGTDTDGTTGMMGDEPPPSRAAAVERVMSRGTLPPDVLARLRALTGQGNG